jgi:CMP-N,N'-diacetyllegionaminic acid synthase
MRIWALVPARGGSRRLAGKHLRPLGGRPLVDWTLAAAREAGVCERILLSSDDPAILARAAHYGAEALPRPAALAGDETSSLAVVRHALDAAGAVRPAALLLLQPTSPLRGPERIRQAARWLAGGGPELVSVGPLPKPGAWLRRLEQNRACPLEGDPGTLRLLNGAIYGLLTRDLLARGTLLPPEVAALEMERGESIDIDDELDWAMAEALLHAGGATQAAAPREVAC